MIEVVWRFAGPKGLHRMNRGFHDCRLGRCLLSAIDFNNVNNSVWGNGIRLRIDLVASAGNPTRHSKQSIG